MRRLPVLLILAAAGASLGSGTALAESYPRPPVCDASTVIPAVSALPAGCPLATFAPQPPPGRPFEPAPQPIVFVYPTDGAPVRAQTAIATSWTTMRGHFSYCLPSTCTDETIDGDVDAVRYDVVFLEFPPVGATLEITGGGATRHVRVTEPGACPPVVAPTASCELPRCGSPDTHCMRPSPLCDGGVDPYPVPQDGPGHDGHYQYPDRDETFDEQRHVGCAAAGPMAASPLLLVALAFVLRHRRR